MDSFFILKLGYRDAFISIRYWTEILSLMSLFPLSISQYEILEVKSDLIDFLLLISICYLREPISSLWSSWSILRPLQVIVPLAVFSLVFVSFVWLSLCLGWKALLFALPFFIQIYPNTLWGPGGSFTGKARKSVGCLFFRLIDVIWVLGFIPYMLSSRVEVFPANPPAASAMLDGVLLATSLNSENKTSIIPVWHFGIYAQLLFTFCSELAKIRTDPCAEYISCFMGSWVLVTLGEGTSWKDGLYPEGIIVRFRGKLFKSLNSNNGSVPGKRGQVLAQMWHVIMRYENLPRYCLAVGLICAVLVPQSTMNFALFLSISSATMSLHFITKPPKKHIE